MHTFPIYKYWPGVCNPRANTDTWGVSGSYGWWTFSQKSHCTSKENCIWTRWTPYWLWRDYASHLAPIITKIFNSSLKHHTVPSMWKWASVTPIPKESPLNDCNQLRPISLNNIILRIFERVVCKQELTALYWSKKLDLTSLLTKKGKIPQWPLLNVNITD